MHVKGKLIIMLNIKTCFHLKPYKQYRATSTIMFNFSHANYEQSICNAHKLNLIKNI